MGGQGGPVAPGGEATDPSTRRRGQRVARTPKNLRDICRWIRERTSPYDIGWKSPDGPRHCNLNRSVLGLFRGLRLGLPRINLARLNNRDLLDHFESEETFYFTADGRGRCREVLVNIDIDCHGAGSPDGAIAFAGFLRENHFPGLYFEASTNGKGAHGYFVVRKGDLGAEALNVALKRLDGWLKDLLARGAWDVENVEVKGQAPEFHWGDGKYELRSYRSGQLAKLPREALARGDELRGTTRLTYEELLRLTQAEVRVAAATPARPPGRGARRGGAPPREAAGSTSGLSIPQELAEQVKGRLLRVARDLFPAGMTTGTGRAVTHEDMATLLAILKYCSENPNADGSTPTARVKALWEGLYRRDYTGRGWDHHRYKVLRDWLSREGHLDWEEEDYVIGREVGGVFRKGQAARWAAGEHLLAMLEDRDAEPGGVAKVPAEAVLSLPSFAEGRRETSLWAEPAPGTLDTLPIRWQPPWKAPRFAGFVGQTRRLAA